MIWSSSLGLLCLCSDLLTYSITASSSATSRSALMSSTKKEILLFHVICKEVALVAVIENLKEKFIATYMKHVILHTQVAPE